MSLHQAAEMCALLQVKMDMSFRLIVVLEITKNEQSKAKQSHFIATIVEPNFSNCSSVSDSKPCHITVL